MSSHRITALAAAASLALSAGVATAAQAPRSTAKPELAQTSNGAMLTYRLSRKSSKQTVTITGRRAEVKLIERETNTYRAFIVRNGLKVGGTYSAKVKVNGSTVISKRLYLHRSSKFPRG